MNFPIGEAVFAGFSGFARNGDQPTILYGKLLEANQ